MWRNEVPRFFFFFFFCNFLGIEVRLRGFKEQRSVFKGAGRGGEERNYLINVIGRHFSV